MCEIETECAPPSTTPGSCSERETEGGREEGRGRGGEGESQRERDRDIQRARGTESAPLNPSALAPAQREGGRGREGERRERGREREKKGERETAGKREGGREGERERERQSTPPSTTPDSCTPRRTLFGQRKGNQFGIILQVVVTGRASKNLWHKLGKYPTRSPLVEGLAF